MRFHCTKNDSNTDDNNTDDNDKHNGDNIYSNDYDDE